MNGVEIAVTRSASAFARVAADLFDDPVRPELLDDVLRRDGHHLCVATDDGQLIGFVSAVEHVHPDKPVQLWINEVSVAPPWRRRGIGRKLVDAMIAHARWLGCCEVWVLTNEDNEAARRLYASAGGDEETGIVMTTFDLDGSR